MFKNKSFRFSQFFWNFFLDLRLGSSHCLTFTKVLSFQNFLQDFTNRCWKNRKLKFDFFGYDFRHSISIHRNRRTLEFGIVTGRGGSGWRKLRQKKSKTSCHLFLFLYSLEVQFLKFSRSLYISDQRKHVIFAPLHDSGLKIVSKQKINTSDT